MVAPNSLALQCSYRQLGAEGCGAAIAYLEEADDALNMALLSLEGSPDDGWADKARHAATARRLLAEAVVQLARARVYVPGVHTYAVNVVTANESDVERELVRLRGLTTTLLWRNHALLPARSEGQPLAPEDEAQLEAMVRDLATHARIDRAMRHKWLMAAALLGALAPLFGVALVFLAAISTAAGAVELARGASPPVLPA